MIESMLQPVLRRGALPAGLLYLIACALTPAAAPPLTEMRAPSPTYDFTLPDASFPLPSALREISGITLLDGDHLGAIQDEEGILYRIEIATGRVVAEDRFAKRGDFEDVERAGDQLFVLRSDGTLFELAGWQQGATTAVEHDTPLSARYDTEGLTYDAAGRRLLIACKEYAGKKMKNQKAIYAFDLQTNTLAETPAFVLDLKETPRSLGGRVDDLDDFKPSAVAIHPATGQLYVLSSVQKVLLVLDADGQVTGAWALPEDLLEQPEGLAFLPNGSLFIASEGVHGAARLLRFDAQ